ncbi:hypothetical protein [Methylobacter sp. BBA5.1]|uniref:hypothetical protein n=1 Tax=Methylobacter sp. BBA5.1 TaxID=1495064 RepID=UPI00055E4389|nr:hypothetical protein [Methylobacter sp. BBA5.1]
MDNNQKESILRSKINSAELTDNQPTGLLGSLKNYNTDNKHDLFEKEYKKLSNKLAKLERHFEESWNQRNKEIENQISSIAHQVSIMGGDAKAAISSLHTNINNAKTISEEKINLLTESVTKADEIIGHLAKTAVAGGYTEAAERERTSADKMRELAVIFFVMAACPMIYLLFEGNGLAIDWPHIASRVLLSVFLLAPATYLVRESSRHREQEITNRKKGMDLATIDPFLKSLPDEMRHNLKIELAKMAYAERETLISKESSNQLGILSELIPDFIKIIKTMKEKDAK